MLISIPTMNEEELLGDLFTGYGGNIRRNFKLKLTIGLGKNIRA
jgi:hypothetical protein